LPKEKRKNNSSEEFTVLHEHVSKEEILVVTLLHFCVEVLILKSQELEMKNKKPSCNLTREERIWSSSSCVVKSGIVLHSGVNRETLELL
jgi:hypothetical protein